MNVCTDRQNQSPLFSRVFPTSPLLLIIIGLTVIVYSLLLSFLCHQFHMVVVCINSYVVHVCVCSLWSLISAQSQQKGMSRVLLRDWSHPCPLAIQYRAAILLHVSHNSHLWLNKVSKNNNVLPHCEIPKVNKRRDVKMVPRCFLSSNGCNFIT